MPTDPTINIYVQCISLEFFFSVLIHQGNIRRFVGGDGIVVSAESEAVKVVNP